jgi:hypothetical protein
MGAPALGTREGCPQYRAAGGADGAALGTREGCPYNRN